MIEDLNIRTIHAAQQRAMLRLQVAFTAETHRILNEFAADARRVLLDAAGDDGVLDQDEATMAAAGLEREWSEMFGTRSSLGVWGEMLQRGKAYAAAIPLGTLAAYHLHYMGESVTEGSGGMDGFARLLEADDADVDLLGTPQFSPQLKRVMQAADARLYGDQLNVSQRVWRLRQNGLSNIQSIMYTGIANGESAWDIAKKLEGELGAGQNCPRWARSRLQSLTKTQIAAGNKTGLLRGNSGDCGSKGVAYNALRLARNEYQHVHHAATDMIWAEMPWIEEEKINLSPSHPPIGCECETIAAGGRDGEGIYPKGQISLPIHVQCLCYKTAVLQSVGDFQKMTKGWVDSTMPGEYPLMDRYAAFVGLDKSDLYSSWERATDNLRRASRTMLAWLFDKADDILNYLREFGI